MKAKYAYESISFERGRDPKKAMGLGGPQDGDLYWVKKGFSTKYASGVEVIWPRSRTGSIIDKFMIFRLVDVQKYEQSNSMRIEYLSYRSLAAAREGRLDGWTHNDVQGNPSSMVVTQEEWDEHFQRVDSNPVKLLNGLRKMYPHSSEL